MAPGSHEFLSLCYPGHHSRAFGRSQKNSPPRPHSISRKYSRKHPDFRRIRTSQGFLKSSPLPLPEKRLRPDCATSGRSGRGLPEILFSLHRKRRFLRYRRSQHQKRRFLRYRSSQHQKHRFDSNTRRPHRTRPACRACSS